MNVGRVIMKIRVSNNEYNKPQYRNAICLILKLMN